MNDMQQFFAQMRKLYPNLTEKATVTAVDSANCACTVKPLNNPNSKVEEVQFRARMGGQDGVIIVPKVGSDVNIIYINNNAADAFIIHTSEVEEVWIDVGGMKQIIKNGQLYQNTETETEKAMLGNSTKIAMQDMNARIDALYNVLKLPAFYAAILASAGDGGASYKSLLEGSFLAVPPAPPLDNILSTKINVG